MIATAKYIGFEPADLSSNCTFEVSASKVRFQGTLDKGATGTFTLEISESLDGVGFKLISSYTLDYAANDLCQFTTATDAYARFYKIAVKSGSAKSVSGNNVTITCMAYSDYQTPTVKCITPPATTV